VLAIVKTVGRSEIEDALNAIASGCKLTRGLNSLNQAWTPTSRPRPPPSAWFWRSWARANGRGSNCRRRYILSEEVERAACDHFDFQNGVCPSSPSGSSLGIKGGRSPNMQNSVIRLGRVALALRWQTMRCAMIGDERSITLAEVTSYMESSVRSVAAIRAKPNRGEHG
jgi:hypothetical protein